MTEQTQNSTNAQQKTNLFFKIAKRIKSRIRQYSKFPITYKYEGFSIQLPPNHLLPEYQKAHPKYDRFLPKLVKHVTSMDTIVDIGANVGDSLAGMAEQNSTSNYICVEPDDYFFKYLEENIARIQTSITSLKIQSIKALVGKNISNVSLDGKGGTKHAVIDGEGGILSMPLDAMIPDSCNVRILKSDVDGFDYDVLDSSMEVIRVHEPIIFFECQYEFDYQKQGYLKTLKKLESMGYCDWTVFDNFGGVIVRTNDMSIVIQLTSYLWQQNIGKSTRTIYYFDILANQKKDSPFIDRVLQEYN